MTDFKKLYIVNIIQGLSLKSRIAPSPRLQERTLRRSKKVNICIIPQNGGKIRTLCISTWVLPSLCSFFAVSMAMMAIFAYNKNNALTLHQDRSAELESLRLTNASQQAQLNVFAERLKTLDSQISLLRTQEKELASLSSDLKDQLNLSHEASLTDMLPLLTETMSWAENNKNGVGGSEQLASALSAAVAGTPRDVIKGMHQDLDRMMMEADDAGSYINHLKDSLSGASSILAATPIILPLERRISSTFGYRRSPFGRSSYEMHRGIDIPAPIGTTIVAPADGTVLSTERNSGGYGLLLAIDHGYGMVTRYAHLSAFLVEPGDEVKRGQPVARTGNSGRSTGPHLHYETVVGGLAVDPLKLLPSYMAQRLVISENSTDDIAKMVEETD